MVPLEQARQEMGPDVALLGNIDPVKTLRNGTPEGVAAAVAECHAQAGPRYIVAPAAKCPAIRLKPTCWHDEVRPSARRVR